MIELYLVKALWTLLVIWLPMAILDGFFDITKQGTPHWWKTIGVSTMLIDIIGWVLYGLYNFFIWV